MNRLWMGIDPGFTGAVAKIYYDGRVAVADIPTIGTGRAKEYDIDNMPNLLVAEDGSNVQASIALEYPTARPGEAPHAAFRFGKGVGIIEGVLATHGDEYERVAPNRWTNRLSLPSKKKSEWKESATNIMEMFYPGVLKDLCTGPRGGFLDGRLDAVFIAHYKRISTVAGLRSIKEQFGKDSEQAWMYMLTVGGKRK